MAPGTVSKSRVIQFGVAPLLVSIGCGLLLTDWGWVFAPICFFLSPIVSLRRSEMRRAVPPRELWISIVTVAVFVALAVLACLFIPRSTGENFIRHPAVIGALWVAIIASWVAMIASLFWRWRRERKSTAA